LNSDGPRNIGSPKTPDEIFQSLDYILGIRDEPIKITRVPKNISYAVQFATLKDIKQIEYYIFI